MNLQGYIRVGIIQATLCGGVIADEYAKSYSAWEAVAFGQDSAAEVVAKFVDLERSWNASSEEHKKFKAYYYAQAAVKSAKRLSDERDYEQAAQFLSKAGEIAKEYPIVLSRGKSDIVFKDLASVHAKVMAEVGNDPLEELPTGYEMVIRGEEFYAVQEGSIPSSVLAPPEFKETETSGTLLHLSANGRVKRELLVALTGSEDESLHSRLVAVYSPWDFDRTLIKDFFQEEEQTP